MQKLSIAVGISLLFFAFSSYIFDPIQARLIGTVAFLVVLWTNEGLPLGVVSLLPIILFPTLGIVDIKTVTPNYSKSIIFLFIGGFLLAMAMQKTFLHERLAKKLLSIFPNTPKGIIYSLAITSAVLSSFLSNTTVTLMMMPIALFLTQNKKLKVRFLIATAYGASIGGIFTPIGTPPNLILLGFLEDIKLTSPTFLEWMMLTFPVVASMLYIVPYILSKSVKDELLEAKLIEKFPPMSSDQKKLSIILISLVVLLIINAPIKPFYNGLGLNEKIILLAFGLILFLPNISILKWEDFKDMPYEIIFLFGAGFSIASAFIKTGLASALAGYFSYFASFPFIVILFLIALFVSFSTEITSNTALTSIALPIFYEFAKNSGFNIEITLFIATIAASYAFMLPIATPPNAIIMSSRVIKIKEMAKIGFLINFIGVAIVSIVAIVFWNNYF
ncbi:SLC13 family permease [Nitrosophilus kaiyonis]|uniref:SLC13 family permease n=1 Tax=Nitrosophilus kaiyonis TaxID=2930200 RepID=UPI00248FEC77|nr:SLC13 family permease [Nitrosophilus kaiyonis]